MADKIYADELREQMNRIAADRAGVAFQWRESELVFSKAAEDGFDVSLLPVADGVVVQTSLGLHVNFEDEPAGAVRDALALARDMLSAQMRIVEHCVGSRPYRWSLERQGVNGWVCEAQTGLLFWNYFGRRRQRTYQNRLLPGRLTDEVRGSAAAEQGDEADEAR